MITSLLYSILSAQCVAGSIITSLESRFGLSFSSRTIIASRFNSTGFIELKTFPATHEYQKYYQETVNAFKEEVPKFQESGTDSDFNEAKVKFIFTDAMKPITEILTKQLGYAPEYAMLFVPSVFGWQMRNAAADALFSDVVYAAKAASARQAACYGYGFLEGKNLGRPMTECNDDGLKSLVLLFEYEKEYLYAWTLEVEFELEVHLALREKICKACGDGYREVSLLSLNLALLHSLIQHQNIGIPMYQERTKKFIHDFVNLEVLAENRREDIRAIVITGEASATSVKELGQAALKAVGTEDVKLMADFKASEVVAYGAAVFARIAQEHPDIFNLCSVNMPYNDAYWAEEVARKERKGEEHNEL
jgi:hypothetical protein